MFKKISDIWHAPKTGPYTELSRYEDNNLLLNIEDSMVDNPKSEMNDPPAPPSMASFSFRRLAEIFSRNSKNGDPTEEVRAKKKGHARTRSHATRDPTNSFRVIDLSPNIRNAPANSSVRPQRFSSNNISTSKYSVWSFLPKFLFEQFSKTSNLFFLFLCIVQQIPGVSPTGRFTTVIPLIFIISVSAFKEIIEDIKRRRSDNYTNKSSTHALKWVWESVFWKAVCVGDILQVRENETFPADIMILSSSDPQNLCYVQTSSLDGETSFKIKQAHQKTCHFNNFETLRTLNGKIMCDLPNNNIYSFNGTFSYENGEGATEKISMNDNNVILRGCQLRNTESVIGIVIYTGVDTKLLRNSSPAPIKTSHMEKTTNKLVLFLIGLLVLTSIISSIIFDINLHINLDEYWYLNIDPKFRFTYHWSFVAFFILYHNFVPISLTVTLEFIKFFSSFLLNYDKRMYDSAKDIYANVKTSNIIEELGQINYIFTDKTGTLTRNVMTLRSISVKGKVYGGSNTSLQASVVYAVSNQYTDRDELKNLILFMRHILLCNSIMADRRNQTEEKTDSSEAEPKESVSYQSSSPDEIALVKGAYFCKFEFIERKVNTVTFKYCISPTSKHYKMEELNNCVYEKWQILNIIEFSSDRKRMSVICRMLEKNINGVAKTDAEEGKIYLFCKGADSVIFDLLTKDSSNDSYSENVLQQLELFARGGLRTLTLSYKIIQPEIYKGWNDLVTEAMYSINDRNERLDTLNTQIENEMSLLGCTGIEDELQPNVSQTIGTLSMANIKFWVLTGDKVETAINIAHSTNLLQEDTSVKIIKNTTVNDVFMQLNQILAKRSGSHGNTNNTNNNNNTLTISYRPSVVQDQKQFHQQPTRNLALVLDSKSLNFCLDSKNSLLFLKLSTMCRTVICCRVSPSQKQAVVLFIKNHVKTAVTLAIGDGANDCAMIQAAHVGVGISGGNEGMQAANSSDFAIAQFSYLRPLLLYHGAVVYRRLCSTIYYCFYKNLLFVLLGAFYTVKNLYSGKTLFSSSLVTLVNMAFTSLPPFSFGLFDQPVSSSAFVNMPNLYGASQTGRIFNYRNFLLWLLNAILHSFMLFFLCYQTFEEGVISLHGAPITTVVFGVIMYTHYLLIVSLKAALELSSWSWITHLCVWGGPALYLVFLLVFCRSFFSFIFEPVMFNADLAIFRSGLFWLSLGIPLLVMLPDFLFTVIRNTIYTPSHLAVAELERSKNVDWQNEVSVYEAQGKIKDLKMKKGKWYKKYMGFAFSTANESLLHKRLFVKNRRKK